MHGVGMRVWGVGSRVVTGFVRSGRVGGNAGLA